MFKDLLNTKQVNSHDLQTQGLASSEKINSPSMRRKWQKDLGRRHLISRFHLDYLFFHMPH